MTEQTDGLSRADIALAEFNAAVREAAEVSALDNPRIPAELEFEGVLHVQKWIAAGAKFVSNYDPAYPHFNGVLTPFPLWGGPTPDTSYSYARLHSDYTYRIYGSRGSAHLCQVEVDSGDFFDMPTQRAFAAAGIDAGPQWGVRSHPEPRNTAGPMDRTPRRPG